MKLYILIILFLLTIIGYTAMFKFLTAFDNLADGQSQETFIGGGSTENVGFSDTVAVTVKRANIYRTGKDIIQNFWMKYQPPRYIGETDFLYLHLFYYSLAAFLFFTLLTLRIVRGY